MGEKAQFTGVNEHFEPIFNVALSSAVVMLGNKTTLNGIENFWNQAKRQMRKFNGIPRQHFHLFLKEYEWRFNAGLQLSFW